MTREPTRRHDRHLALLVAAGALDIAASFLSFVVFRRASPLYFPLAALVTIALLTAGIFVNRVALYFYELWLLVGVVSQLPLRPLSERLPVFVANLVAATLTFAYLMLKRLPNEAGPERRHGEVGGG
jgi:hypothetical protein